MKLTLIQQNIIWARPQQNREHIQSLLPAKGESDLVVLPEMFSTGFAPLPEGVAEDAQNSSLQWMKEQAEQRDMAIAGSIAVHENGGYYNRFLFVKPGGEVTSYDKRHLFTFSGENKRFNAGNERRIVQWRGVRFNLIVCYDLRFPAWVRNHKDYDVLLCVASWPDVRRQAWDTLTRARAIENQCYVAAVNRVGHDFSCHYNGGTALIDPWGTTKAAAQDNQEQIITYEIDLADLQSFRANFPVLDDADKYEMI